MNLNVYRPFILCTYYLMILWFLVRTIKAEEMQPGRRETEKKEVTIRDQSEDSAVITLQNGSYVIEQPLINDILSALQTYPERVQYNVNINLWIPSHALGNSSSGDNEINSKSNSNYFSSTLNSLRKNSSHSARKNEYALNKNMKENIIPLSLLGMFEKGQLGNSSNEFKPKFRKVGHMPLSNTMSIYQEKTDGRKTNPRFSARLKMKQIIKNSSPNNINSFKSKVNNKYKRFKRDAKKKYFRDFKNVYKKPRDVVVTSDSITVNIPKTPKKKYPRFINFNRRIGSILPERFLPNKAFHNKWRPRPKPNSSLYRPNTFTSTIKSTNFGSDHLQTILQEPVSTPSSFDDLSFGSDFVEDVKQLDIPRRLSKLDSIFKALHVNSEDCKKKVLCEVSKDADNFSPLAEILQHETRITDGLRQAGKELASSREGIRYLSYIDATTRGKGRYSNCEIYKYNCLYTVRDLIDMDALVVWREVVGWLTVKVLTNEGRLPRHSRADID